jgi:type IV pilus assembly protein PilV
MLCVQPESKVTGFSMIEILISLLIVLTSVMGVAGLVVRVTQQDVEAAQRIEGLVFLQDMVDRIQANQQVVGCYSNGAAGVVVGTGVDQIPDCNAGTASQAARAEADLESWGELLKGSAIREGGANTGGLIGARGCITEMDAVNGVYRASVVWQGVGPTVAPSNLCGQNLYGAENLRRVISAVIRVGS